MADIFISYAHEDRGAARQMAQCLEETGLTVWWDRKLSAGVEFAKMIEAEIEQAGHVIVVWSETSLDSNWVRDEADYARERGKYLPVSLDGSLPPLGFRQLQTISFGGWTGTRTEPPFREVLEALRIETPAPASRASPSSPTRVTRPGVSIRKFSHTGSGGLEAATIGLTTDIVTAFSSIRHFAVEASSTEEQHAVRYRIEGAARPLGDRVRVNIQLIAAESGLNLWADSFDAPRDEFERSPDDLVERIFGRLYVQIVSAEADRALAMPEADLGAWEYCQRVAFQIPRVWADDHVPERLEAELKRALELDPEYGLGHALMSWSCKSIVVNGMCKPGEVGDYWRRGEIHLGAARRFAGRDILCEIYIGAAENYSGLHEQSLQTLDRVISRNPAIAEAWCFLSMPNAYLGRYDVAREVLDRAEKLSPDAGFAMTREWYRALVEFLAGEYAACLPNAELTASVQPAYGYAHAVAAICKARLGRRDEAIADLRRATDRSPYLQPQGFAVQILNQIDAEKGTDDFSLIKELWDAV